jgi:hypothetical protein
VSFGDLFDGYCVVHAPFATAERRPWFEAELHRIGVDRITVVEAPQIRADDPRVAVYQRKAAELSNLDAVRSIIELARRSSWRSVVVMEDDVAFRSNFTSLWAEVEPEVIGTEWDALLLYRYPKDGAVVVVEPRGRTTLVPLLDSIGNFCTVVRAQAFDAVLASLDHCFAEHWPSDFYYGHFTRRFGGRLMATSRNLAGQASFASSLQSLTRGSTFYARFRSCRSPLEARVVSGVYAASRRLRRLL